MLGQIPLGVMTEGHGGIFPEGTVQADAFSAIARELRVGVSV
jgi:hypothetical protein